MKFKIGDLVAYRRDCVSALTALGFVEYVAPRVGLVMHIAPFRLSLERAKRTLNHSTWHHVEVLWAGSTNTVTYFAHHLIAFNSQDETNETV